MPVPASWVDDESAPDPQLARDHLAAHVAAALRPASAVLSVFYLVLCVVHPLVVGGSDGRTLSLMAGLSSVVLGALTVTIWRSPPRPRLGRPLMALLLAVVALNSLTHMVLTSQPQQSVNILFVLVAAGAALLDHRWYAGTAAVVWIAWGAAALAVGGDPQTWIHWVFSMGTATMLGAVINSGRIASLDAMAEALDRAERAAIQDGLSGLANRRGLALLGRELVAIARRMGDAVHCSFVDIDGLKRVNDDLGHDAGDSVILAVSESLRTVTRTTDVVARWGGDEFVVVGLGAGMSPSELESRVRGRLLALYPPQHPCRAVRVSVGRSVLDPWNEGDLVTLLEAADRDMYLRRSMRIAPLAPVLPQPRVENRRRQDG